MTVIYMKKRGILFHKNIFGEDTKLVLHIMIMIHLMHTMINNYKFGNLQFLINIIIKVNNIAMVIIYMNNHGIILFNSMFGEEDNLIHMFMKKDIMNIIGMKNHRHINGNLYQIMKSLILLMSIIGIKKLNPIKGNRRVVIHMIMMMESMNINGIIKLNHIKLKRNNKLLKKVNMNIIGIMKQILIILEEKTIMKNIHTELMKYFFFLVY